MCFFLKDDKHRDYLDGKEGDEPTGMLLRCLRWQDETWKISALLPALSLKTVQGSTWQCYTYLFQRNPSLTGGQTKRMPQRVGKYWDTLIRRAENVMNCKMCLIKTKKIVICEKWFNFVDGHMGQNKVILFPMWWNKLLLSLPTLNVSYKWIARLFFCECCIFREIEA